MGTVPQDHDGQLARGFIRRTEVRSLVTELLRQTGGQLALNLLPSLS
jgi:hypothetical protein